MSVTQLRIGKMILTLKGDAENREMGDGERTLEFEQRRKNEKKTHRTFEQTPIF
jgi:hypothetical protein